MTEIFNWKGCACNSISNLWKCCEIVFLSGLIDYCSLFIIDSLLFIVDSFLFDSCKLIILFTYCLLRIVGDVWSHMDYAQLSQHTSSYISINQSNNFCFCLFLCLFLIVEDREKIRDIIQPKATGTNITLHSNGVSLIFIYIVYVIHALNSTSWSSMYNEEISMRQWNVRLFSVFICFI